MAMIWSHIRNFLQTWSWMAIIYSIHWTLALIIIGHNLGINTYQLSIAIDFHLGHWIIISINDFRSLKSRYTAIHVANYKLWCTAKLFRDIIMRLYFIIIWWLSSTTTMVAQFVECSLCMWQVVGSNPC